MKYKVFISQPMNGKTAEEILSAREKAIASAKHFVEETMADAFEDVEVEILDSYFGDDEDILNHPQWIWSISLRIMKRHGDAALNMIVRWNTD